MDTTNLTSYTPPLPSYDAALLCQQSYQEYTFVGFNQQQEVLYLETDSLRTLVFRGSDELADWTDININYRPATIHRGMRVAAGFLNAFSSVFYPIQETLGKSNHSLPLYVLGHSLGGAVGGIAADIFEADGYISFGCPRFACPAYADYLGPRIKYKKRLAFWNDPIQYAGGICSYRHICPVTWLQPDIWCPPVLHLIKHYVRVLKPNSQDI